MTMTPANINRNLLISFVELFDTTAFKVTFSFVELSLKGIVELVTTAVVLAARKLMK